MTAIVPPFPLPRRSYGNRNGKARNYCSLCDQRGHNRRNRAFHPDTTPVEKHDGAKYAKRYRFKLAVKAECHCGARIVEKTRSGEPRSRCRACLDKNRDWKRAKFATLKRYEEALEDIRCRSLEKFAVETADEALEYMAGKRQQRKAA
jgi:hypothetical protein